MTSPRLRPSPITKQAQDVIEVLAESELFREAAASINRALQIEDEQWAMLVGGGDSYDGLTLDALKELSGSIREAMLKSPIVGRGAHLRHSYTWSKGVKMPNTKPADYGTRSGPRSSKDKAHEAFLNPVNQHNVFSDIAHEEMERSLYSDGAFFLLGDLKTRTLRRVPLAEITAFITNPDFADEVWAWRRTWRSTNARGKTEVKNVWYYTDDCPATPKERAKGQIQNDPVDHTKVFIVQAVNRQVGWPLGIPDAVSIIAWAKLYNEFLKYGYIMNRALATIAFKSTPASKTQGEKQAVRLASATGAGQAAIGGDLTAMPTAGRGYDFDAGRPIAAMVATGIQVSIVHLLSDPGAAGSSYGSASNLDLPTKRAIVSRQKSWALFLERVLRFIGIDEPVVTFPSLEEPDFYREIQALVYAWTTGLLHPDEIRARLLALLDIITDETGAPDGVMTPNNENSILRPDVDGDGSVEPGATTQGKNTGTGKARDSHDLDSMSESLSRLEISEKLGEILRLLSD